MTSDSRNGFANIDKPFPEGLMPAWNTKVSNTLKLYCDIILVFVICIKNGCTKLGMYTSRCSTFLF